MTALRVLTKEESLIYLKTTKDLPRGLLDLLREDFDLGKIRLHLDTSDSTVSTEFISANDGVQ